MFIALRLLPAIAVAILPMPAWAEAPRMRIYDADMIVPTVRLTIDAEIRAWR